MTTKVHIHPEVSNDARGHQEDRSQDQTKRSLLLSSDHTPALTGSLRFESPVNITTSRLTSPEPFWNPKLGKRAGIQGWVDRLPIAPDLTSIIKAPDAHEQDLDPVSFTAIPPIVQPPTEPDDSHPRNSREAYRVQTWTSEWLIKREIQVRKQMQRIHKQPRQKVAQESMNFSFQVQRQIKPETPAEPPFRVRLASVFRPATVGDIEEVTRIFYQAIQSSEGVIPGMPEEELRAVIDTSLKESMPFVVASEEAVDLDDSSMWPSRAAFSKFQRCLASVPQAKVTQLYGFALATPLQIGGLLSGRESSDSVEISIFVDPAFRRQNVGRNLIDVILSTTVSGYQFGNGCEWTGNEDMAVRKPFQNVSISAVFRPGIDDNRYAWTKAFLEGEFMLKETGRIRNAHRLPGADGGGNHLDKVTWAIHSPEYRQPKAASDSSSVFS